MDSKSNNSNNEITPKEDSKEPLAEEKNITSHQKSFEEIIADKETRPQNDSSPLSLMEESQTSVLQPIAQKSRNGGAIIGWSLAATLLIAGVGYTAINFLQHNEAAKQQEIIEEEKKVIEKEREQTLKETPNPLAVLSAANAPEVVAGELKSSVSTEESINGIIQVSDGTSLYINDGKFIAPVNECITVEPTDFCLAARAEYRETKFDIYLVKDLANTRLAEDPKDFKEFKTAFDKLKPETTIIAATMAIDINNEQIPIAAITKNGGTGFLYFFAAGTSQDMINEILEKSSLQQS